MSIIVHFFLLSSGITLNVVTVISLSIHLLMDAYFKFLTIVSRATTSLYVAKCFHFSWVHTLG